MPSTARMTKPKTATERLIARARARGLQTRDERNAREMMNSPAGLSLVSNLMDYKNRIDEWLTPYPDHKLTYISMLAYIEHPEKLRELTRFIKHHHGDAKNDTDRVVDTLIRAGRSDRAMTEARLMGFWVLRHNDEIVCVATMYRGVQLTYLTTMREHRHKGYALLLVRFLGDFYQHVSGCIYGASAPEILPLFERAGWTRPLPLRPNRDNSFDVVPPHFHEQYEVLRQTGGAVPPRIAENLFRVLPSLMCLGLDLLVGDKDYFATA